MITRFSVPSHTGSGFFDVLCIGDERQNLPSKKELDQVISGQVAAIDTLA